MKTLLKVLGILLVTTLVFSSCSKDDDPVDNDLFVGNYDGAVSYVNLENGDANFSSDNSRVTVVKASGDNYNFMFRDSEIPNLMGITMQKGDNNNLIFEDGEVAVIRITASELYIAYTREDQIWTANCNR